MAVAQVICGTRESVRRGCRDVKHLLRSCDDPDQSSIVGFQNITVNQVGAPRQENRCFGAVFENRAETSLLPYFKGKRKPADAGRALDFPSGVLFNPEHD
jgi:hypothetical protein